MKSTGMKTKTAVIVKKIAGKMADVSCGAASCWGLHQAKEPKKCKK